MQRVLLYFVRGLISLIYCMVIGLLFHRFLEFDWGASFALSGFIFIILGSLLFSSGSRSLPIVRMGSTNPNSVDSTAIREYSDVGTNVADAENQIDNTRLNSRIKQNSGYSISDILFNRTAIETILTGILGIIIGLSTYIEYFI